ncbi:prenyltransferase/squalene oxidase repeat-containing protein [Engelhardtia mirabilis]|uniref:Squalene cyclase C-terminal domain-containing protein n=1 Tax=Engelhardtia mirabilis TaxID=2528011 RepID=A0A518BRK9_9BACT|nr:hypothetical protein Pla133_47340 [Planctomycetes bacterium Pla133]QDV03940.1 hypothetical protein Pla86_47320 [Planctomycetes bacterium Pla86]
MSQQDYSHIHVETTLPKPWEEEQTFNDVLYDWMGRAPWLAISFAAHIVFYFILAAIPWDEMSKKEEVILQADIITPPEEIFEEPEEEEIEEIEEEIIEEPIIQDSEVVEETDDVSEDLDSDLPESPFDSNQFNDVIGIGGGAGGGGGKTGGRRSGRKKVGKGVEKALLAGLEWLKDHQSEDGHWDADDFPVECDKEPPYSDGEGSALHDVGLTGLALLAFLGFGDTMNDGQYHETIRSGISWLQKQQDRSTGLIGEQTASNFIYNHAIAALALCEAQYGAPNPILKKSAQNAVNYIHRARNPYSAWRYQVPPDNTNDTSVTGWMVFALSAAQDAKLNVETDAYRGSLSWFDEVTDPTTGRTGYTQIGEGSARPRHLQEFYKAEYTEALTAVSVLCRVFIANILNEPIKDDDRQKELVERGIELMMEHLPEWSEDGSLNDMYYWYYASYALYQLSEQYSSAWTKWEKALSDALLPSQRTSPPCFEGSWDPIGPWGHEGGRVYSTAIGVLCLEVYFRYGKVLGSR